MSLANDFLRSLGMSDDQITSAHASLDQDRAEADHLIDHGLSLFRGSLENAAIEGTLIRSHLETKDEGKLRDLLAALIIRAGGLADVVERQMKEIARLKAETPAAAEGAE